MAKDKIDLIQKINQKVLLILTILTIIPFIIFTAYIFLGTQVLDFINLDLIKNLEINLVYQIDSIQDKILLLKIIPEFLIFLIFSISLCIFEFKHEKDNFNTVLVKLLISFGFIYFLYVNIFGTGMFGFDIYNRYLRNIYLYKVLNFSLMIMLTFIVYYILYNLYILYRFIRYNKQNVVFDIINIGKILYTPFLIIILIVSILNIFNIVTIRYLVHLLREVFSLESIIDLSNVLSFVSGGTFQGNVPDFIINIINFLKNNTYLGNSQLSLEFIDQIFDITILRAIDDRVYNFLMSFFNIGSIDYLVNFILVSVLVVGRFIIKHYNKRRYIDLGLVTIILIILFPIQGLIFNIIRVFLAFYIIGFLGLIIYDNKELIKKISN